MGCFKVAFFMVPMVPALVAMVAMGVFSAPEDLTPLLAEYSGPLAQPIIAAAGSDISFWFDEAVR